MFTYTLMWTGFRKPRERDACKGLGQAYAAEANKYKICYIILEISNKIMYNYIKHILEYVFYCSLE